MSEGVTIAMSGTYRTVMLGVAEQLESQDGIAKFGAGKHGANARQNRGWNCLGNLIYAVAGKLGLRGMTPLMYQLDALISELFPARELASHYSSDTKPITGFQKIYTFNDHEDTTREDELALVATWLERNPE